jgi:hypothetical protein
MKSLKICVLLLASLSLFGCYATRIDTGRTPSSKVISKPWASCWLYGLVPPPTVETATDCPDGVALVQTQHSFLNYVVGAITFGIFTPIQITVTCAEAAKTGYVDPAQELVVPHGATPDEVRQVFSRAADRAVKSGETVVVHLEQ